MHSYVNISKYLSLYFSIYIYVYIYINIYIYIYIYSYIMQMYTYLYIYIYTCIDVLLFSCIDASTYLCNMPKAIPKRHCVQIHPQSDRTLTGIDVWILRYWCIEYWGIHLLIYTHILIHVLKHFRTYIAHPLRQMHRPGDMFSIRQLRYTADVTDSSIKWDKRMWNILAV